MKNKIGWCNTTWNPVWGCLNNCEYCYARRIAKRFAGDIAEFEIDYIYGSNIDGNSLNAYYEEKKENIKSFKPTFLYSQFEKKLPKRPQRIFVGSMSEIYYWGDKWMERVLGKINQHPQHIFQFLTRYPQVYVKYDFPKNCWLGVTITTNTDINYYSIYNQIGAAKGNIYFYSIEPLLNKVNPEFLKGIDWVIIGAETGNRKDKVIPNGSWVFNILDFCNRHNIPIYIKDNLVKYYSEYGGYKQFPKGIKV